MLLLFLIGFGAVVAAVSSSSSSSGPAASSLVPTATPSSVPLDTDARLAAWMAAARKSEEQLTKAKAARDAENNTRIETIRAIGKYVPLVGQAWSGLVDIGVWFGQRLGSAYKEENAAEDIAYAGDQVELWLLHGWIPHAFAPTSKSGANSYGLELHNQFEAAMGRYGTPALRALDVDALLTIGALSIKWGNNVSVAPLLTRIGAGGGTFAYGGNAMDAANRLLGVLAGLETAQDPEVLSGRAVAAYASDIGAPGPYGMARRARTFLALVRGGSTSSTVVDRIVG